MQIKAVTVLALALVADSANASLWKLWKRPNPESSLSLTTDSALSEPTVELPSADSSASPVVASELTVPEINVLAPKGSSQEQQQEDQESSVEPAQEVAEVEPPKVDGAPADQEAGRSFLGRLNPRNWFSRNDSTTKPGLVVKVGEPIMRIPQKKTDAPLTEAEQSLDESALPGTDDQEEGKLIAGDLADQLKDVSLEDVPTGKDGLDASSTEETSDEESEGEEEN